MNTNNLRDNYLQFWGKELNQDEEKEEKIELQGPVGQVLERYESEHKDQISYASEDSFEIQSQFYQPDLENLEGFFNEAPKDLEQIIDE